MTGASSALDRPRAAPGAVPVRQRVGVAVLGCGTVGTGVVQVLLGKAEMLAEKVGCPLSLVGVAVRDAGKPRHAAVPRHLLTDDAEALLSRPDVDVVVELIGGLEPARSLVLSALSRGKTVVTANKACLAAHFDEVAHAAREARADLFIEAAVCAGVPVLQALRDGLAANRVRGLMGILNGTCNYILTRMAYDGAEFAQALAEAQRRGFAEADPDLDVSGRDAAQKLAILASLAFGAGVREEHVHTEGIGAVTALDLRTIRERFDATVKLLGVAKQEEPGGPLELRVHPCILSAGHLLASVDDCENAVWVSGDVVGSLMFFGPGAGALPTASAVVADVVAAARDVRVGLAGSVPGLHVRQTPGVRVKPMDALTCRYYFRVTADDTAGLTARVSGVLERNGLSVSSVLRTPESGTARAHVAAMTEEAVEADAKRAYAELTLLPGVAGPVAMLRTERDGQYSRGQEAAGA